MRVTRRGLVVGGAATAAAAAVAVTETRTGSGPEPTAAAGPLPTPARPPRQHAWNDVLHRDDARNVLPPRYQRLLLCGLADDPTPERARRAELALRRVEERVALGPSGLLLVVGWGPAWFRRIGVPSPVPSARALSDTEAPNLDDPIAVLHLGSDDAALLDHVERALFRGGALDDASSRGPGRTEAAPTADLRGLLRVTGRRTGFVGAGLPRAHQRGTVGLPQDRRVDRSAPLFMGFQSGLRRNQATEDDVTIADGPWAGGTTMHVSAMDLTLSSWYHGIDDAGRVRRMFRADASPRDVDRRPAGLSNPDVDLAAVARRRGVVGHAEAMASVRRDGRPRILRRDFNSTDGGAAQVHFVSLQRSIQDFELTRTAMNAVKAIDVDAGVGAQVNNGINEWMTVTARANLLVPPRASRICPGLAGWAA